MPPGATGPVGPPRRRPSGEMLRVVRDHAARVLDALRCPAVSPQQDRCMQPLGHAGKHRAAVEDGGAEWT